MQMNASSIVNQKAEGKSWASSCPHLTMPP